MKVSSDEQTPHCSGVVRRITNGKTRAVEANNMKLTNAFLLWDVKLHGFFLCKFLYLFYVLDKEPKLLLVLPLSFGTQF